MTLTIKKTLSLVLTVALVLGMMPTSAFAESGDLPSIQQTGTITGFAYLEEIKIEKGTAEVDIPFPDTVTAMVQYDDYFDEETSTQTQLEEVSAQVLVGEWQLAFGSYDPDVENTRYVFEAVRESLALPDGVILPDDVELPCVAVDIGKVEVGITAIDDGTSLTYINLSTDNDGNSAAGDTEGTGYTWVQNTKTLTLNNFNLSTEAPGTVNSGNNNYRYALRLPKGSKIVLTGTNTIANNGSDSTLAVYGIHALGDLTIEGNGSLTVTTGTSSGTSEVGDSRAIMVGQNLTMKSGTLTATGNTSTNSDSDGIKVLGDFKMEGGAITATGGSAGKNGCGMAVNTFTMSGGTINVTGATGTGGASNSGGIYSNYAFNMTGGIITALGAGAPETYGIGGGSTFNITGGTITTTGGASTTGHSRGFHAWANSTFTIGGTADITAIGGTANGAAAVSNSVGLFSGGTVNMTGGKLTASSGTVNSGMNVKSYPVASTIS